MYVEDRLYFNREVPWENAIILKGNSDLILLIFIVFFYYFLHR